MYVIGDAANARWLDTVLFRDSAWIRPKTFSDLGAEHWNSLFCTEDAVDIQGIKCVRHRVIVLINPYIMQLYFDMFYYCRDSSFSSIVPAWTAHLSLTFPGTSYRATVTSSRPGRFLTSTKNPSTSLPTAGEAYHEYRQHSLSLRQSPRTDQSTLPDPLYRHIPHRFANPVYSCGNCPAQC